MDNDKTQKYLNEIKYLKRKNEYYRYLLLTLIFIFSVTVYFTNIDDEQIKAILRKKILSQSRIYMKKCFDGILLNNNNKNATSQNPKISAVIPLYNCQKTIKAAVRSIQNQNMADIEIILVNDYSKDNTLQIIQELAKEDPRIKIINNEKNMATLYSRNLGVLKSKGKYIMNLDNDDLFMTPEIFDISYEEAEKGNFDLVGFSAVECYDYNSLVSDMEEAIFHDHQDGIEVYQPDLTYFAISRNSDKYQPNDLHVWGRITRTDLYKKAINNFGRNELGELRNSCFVTWAEDSAMSMAILRFAHSYKFIQKYGIFHYLGGTTASITSKGELRMYGELFFIDAVFDFTYNDFRGKRFAVQMTHQDFFDDVNDLYSKKNAKYFIAILKKMLACQYINFEDKKYLQEKMNQINSVYID